MRGGKKGVDTERGWAEGREERGGYREGEG